MRVHLGIWVICETPDFGDLERLKRNSMGDEELIENIELSLEQRGNRKSLEEAISRNAPNIYQEIIAGNLSQMGIGINNNDEDLRRMR